MLTHICTRTNTPAHMLKQKSIPVSGLIGVNTLKMSAACLLIQISWLAAFRGAQSVAGFVGGGA